MVPFGVSSKTGTNSLRNYPVLALAIWLSYFGNDFSFLQGRVLAGGDTLGYRLLCTIRRLFYERQWD